MSHRRMIAKGPQGGLPYTPPLDAANAAAAYSVRKLRTAYTGPCVRVSDNPGFFGGTKDVGFDSNGYLDVSQLYTSSYVRTWYDQTGNGLDFVSNTVGDTPIIQLSGVLQTVNGLAALKFDGVGNFLTSPSNRPTFNNKQYGSVYGVYKIDNVAGDQFNLHFFNSGTVVGNARHTIYGNLTSFVPPKKPGLSDTLTQGPVYAVLSFLTE